MRKRLTRLSLITLTGCLGLFAKIVPYRCGVWAGGIIGVLAYYLLPRDRKRALVHLSAVFPDKGDAWVRQTARACFKHLGTALLEVMLIDSRRLPRVVEFQNAEKLKAVLRQGKGTVFVTGHIGNWELMAAAVAELAPLSVIAAPIEPERLNDTIVSLRARMGVRTVLRGVPGAAREMIRVFKENRILGILIDQDTDVDGAFIDFMGRPAWTPTAAAQLAIRFNAPLVFGYIRRGENNKHVIYLDGPLDMVRTGNIEKDIVSNTAMLNKKIEQAILQVPEQWVWMHRRWRRQP